MGVMKLAMPMLELPRQAKRIIALLIDLSTCILSVWFAYFLRLGYFIQLEGGALAAALVSVALALPLFVVFGLYRAIFRFAGGAAFAAIAQACATYGLFYATVFAVFGVDGVPRTIGLIQPGLLFILVAAWRAGARFWLGGLYRSALQRQALKRVLIYGAGSSGRQLAAAMASSVEIKVVGFLDDDPRLHGRTLNGLQVSNPKQLERIRDKLQVTDIFLAMPSVDREHRNRILRALVDAGVRVRTLPGLMDIAQGKVQATDLRELDVEDLLGRQAVTADEQLMTRNVRGKTILITGAGGSIGSEICRQLLASRPAVLLLLELSEFALYSIHQDLSRKIDSDMEADVRIVPLLGSVLDEPRIREIVSVWRPDGIFHAAAFKHVPMVEHNLIEGVRNNVIGTMIVANVARELGVQHFVLVSTDKAVRPTNVMGASKRLAELILQGLATLETGTCFSIVRFGNVLGSSGSVVPLFRKQIALGGPLTLTHPDIIRYFMTIPEAAQLVVQAGAIASGGEVFVLDMGEPVRVRDLATNMIRLAGHTVRDAEHPHGDIAIEVVGLRPGEKLFEELLIGDDPTPTAHPRIMMARERFIPWDELAPKIVELQKWIERRDVQKVRNMLLELVSGYQPDGEIVDWVTVAEFGRVAPSELVSSKELRPVASPR